MKHYATTNISAHLAAVNVLPVPGNAPKGRAPRHTVHVIDVSGSMWGNLEEIGTNMEQTLLDSVAPGDLLSVIYFSGRNQAGTIFKLRSISHLADRDEAARQVRKWLQPIGLTGFVDPLKLVEELATESPLPTVMNFMTDGGENVNPREKVFEICRRLNGVLASSSITEYGRWADRSMLSKMAESLGATRHAVEESQAFNDLANDITRNGQSAPRVKVEVPAEARYVATVDESGPQFYQIEDNAVLLPEGSGQMIIFSSLPNLAGAKPEGDLQDALYLHLIHAAGQMDIDEVEHTLMELGDKELIQDSARLFGKMRFSAFETKVRAMLQDQTLRYREGFDPAAFPDPDAPTLLDVMDILNDGETRVLIKDPEFKFTRVSRGRQELTLNEEQEALKKSIAQAQDDKAREKAQKKLSELFVRSEARASFELDEEAVQEGLVIDGLVTHESRANLSIRVRQPGQVTLASGPEGLPRSIQSFKIRNYNVVFSGVTLMDRLPIRPSALAAEKLKAMKLIPQETLSGDRVVLELAELAVVNRKETNNVSPELLADAAAQDVRAGARLKVLNQARKNLFVPKTSAGFEQEFGAEAASWLRTVGLTDFAFNPPTTSREATDVMQITELHLDVKVDQHKTIPSVNDVFKKQAAGKALNGPERLMMEVIQELQSDQAAHPGEADYFQPGQGSERQRSYLDERIAQEVATQRRAARTLQSARMAVLVAGRTFGGQAEATRTVTVAGMPFTVAMKTTETTEAI